MRDDLCRQFDRNLFAWYPTVDVLTSLIEIEERQIARRLLAVLCGDFDPGRPSYKDSYANFPRSSLYTFAFRREFKNLHSAIYRDQEGKIYSVDRSSASDDQPYFPDLPLACSPNIAVKMGFGVVVEAARRDETFKVCNVFVPRSRLTFSATETARSGRLFNDIVGVLSWKRHRRTTRISTRLYFAQAEYFIVIDAVSWFAPNDFHASGYHH